LTLTVGGKLIDTGAGQIFMFGDTVNGTQGLNIANGGVFIPGGDTIGTSTVTFDPSPNTYPGRLLLSAGSTNIFKVNPVTQASTMVLENVLGLGPNQNAQSVNGCTIVMSNVTASPFAAGQTFTLFQYLFGGGPHNASTNTANSYPLISPQAPGPGLYWDLRNITNTGAISIHSVATSPIMPNFSFGITNGFVITNITSTSTNSTTNNYGIVHITWPSSYEGWSLQEQVSANNVGLISSNWGTIFGSFWTNEVWLTNVITTNSHFYRMMLPQ
jgi:hypothetical protein